MYWSCSGLIEIAFHIFQNTFHNEAVEYGGVKKTKVGKVKTDKQIIYHVTAPMSGHFFNFKSDRSSLAKSP